METWELGVMDSKREVKRAHRKLRVLSAGLASPHQGPRMAMEATAHAAMQRVKAY
jgi:hypothetical protein